MKIIQKPRYQSFTGKVYSSKAECEYDDKVYCIHILEELKRLKKYCNDNHCDECPFSLGDSRCNIAFLLKGETPSGWRDWE